MEQVFYDNFTKAQLKNSFNLRHFILRKKLKSIINQQNCNILEVGCGIGVFSYIIKNTFPNCSLTSFDYSEESIRVAKKLNKNNISFFASDANSFIEKLNLNTQFNYIVLLDVLEHIHKHNHEQIFKQLTQVLSDEGKIIINIPNPSILKYYKITSPEVLQPIEEEIYFSDFQKICMELDLSIELFEEFNIWLHSESHFYIIRRNKKDAFYKDIEKLTFKEKMLQKWYYKLTVGKHYK